MLCIPVPLLAFSCLGYWVLSGHQDLLLWNRAGAQPVQTDPSALWTSAPSYLESSLCGAPALSRVVCSRFVSQSCHICLLFWGSCSHFWSLGNISYFTLKLPPLFFKLWFYRGCVQVTPGAANAWEWQPCPDRKQHFTVPSPFSGSYIPSVCSQCPLSRGVMSIGGDLCFVFNDVAADRLPLSQWIVPYHAQVGSTNWT